MCTSTHRPNRNQIIQFANCCEMRSGQCSLHKLRFLLRKVGDEWREYLSIAKCTHVHTRCLVLTALRIHLRKLFQIGSTPLMRWVSVFAYCGTRHAVNRNFWRPKIAIVFVCDATNEYACIFTTCGSARTKRSRFISAINCVNGTVCIVNAQWNHCSLLPHHQFADLLSSHKFRMLVCRSRAFDAFSMAIREVVKDSISVVDFRLNFALHSSLSPNDKLPLTEPNINWNAHK